MKTYKDGYQRPSITATEMLTEDDISKLLEDYIKCDISTVKIGTHLRYFTTVKNATKFRRGGFLKNKDGFPDYVLLTNNKINWCVQIKNAEFYRKLTIQEIKDFYYKLYLQEKDKVKELNKRLIMFKKN